MKTFSGWDVRCYPVQTPAPCDMWEAIAFKKGGALAVSVSIVFVPSRNEHLLQFVVPLGIDLPKGAKLVAGGYTSEMWHYHHCDRIGCYVIVPQGNAIVDALKGQPDMKVRVVQFHGKSFDLNVPLKGFDEAHDSMVELARKRRRPRPLRRRTRILKFRTYTVCSGVAGRPATIRTNFRSLTLLFDGEGRCRALG